MRPDVLGNLQQRKAHQYGRPPMLQVREMLSLGLLLGKEARSNLQEENLVLPMLHSVLSQLKHQVGVRRD